MATIPRTPNDTPKAYAALCDYIAMGAGRSLRDLAAQYRRQSVDGSSTAKPPTTRFETLGTWSKANDWQKRAQAADDAQRAADEAARAEIRAARRIALENADWEQGEALRSAVGSILSELPRFIRQNISRVERVDPLTKATTITEVITLALKAGPGELARALELASKLQRLSVGEATEQTDSHQTIEIRYVNDSTDDETTTPGAAHDST